MSSYSRRGYDDYNRKRERSDDFGSRGHRNIDSYTSSRRRSRSRSPDDRYSRRRRGGDEDESYSRSNQRLDGDSSSLRYDDRKERRGDERDRSGYQSRNSRGSPSRSRNYDDGTNGRGNSRASATHIPPNNVQAGDTPKVMDEKQKAKKEKLEAWRRERERKAAEEAKKKAENLPGSLRNDKLTHTSIKATGLKGLTATKTPSFVKEKNNTISAMDDTSEGPKQLERFTLPEMQDIQSGSVSDDDDGPIEEEEVHGNRADIAATLKEKREAAAHTDDTKMEVDGDEGEEDIDPLDAFMAGVSSEVREVNEADRRRLGKGTSSSLAEVVGGGNADELGLEEMDGQADELDNAGTSDILAMAASKVKRKEMPTIDHSIVEYEPFRKAFYHPPAEIDDMSEEEAEHLRMEMDAIKVRGKDCPKPLTKWSYCGLPGSCLDVIKRLDYKAPTAIQAQAIPAIMSGRDMIGVAKTGSGKTMAFLLPMFRHIKDQRPVEALEGPIGLIMTPTRELAVQIYRESKPFLKALNLRAACVYGGAPISEQIAEMKKTCDFVVATPGRMIDLLTANSGRVTNLKRVTYLVLDEADRMFDMGFEPQVMKIVNNVRPDRQTVLFSATFPKQMESLARKVLKHKPLEITVGGRSVVAPEIEQIVEVRQESTKFNRLLEILGRTYMDDENCRTLIFVERQESADDLLTELMKKGYATMSIHGGKDQVDRDSTISDFKAGIVPIVTATSVAARGLDVKQLKLVVNYDVPNHMEDYVHRAGRTGRAGNKGVCITFITPEQDKYARDVIAALRASKVAVPPELEKLAEDFKLKIQSGKAQAATSGFGGKGLERFESDREKALAAQRRAYGEDDAPSKQSEDKGDKEVFDNEDYRQVNELKVEVKRGAAPESIRDNRVGLSDMEPLRRNANSVDQVDLGLSARNAKILESAKAKGADTTKLAAALARIKAITEGGMPSREQADRARKTRDPDATDFHAIVPINDFPQRARWRVTNKETMTQLIADTGASITNKGAFYEKGKDPQLGEPPKLQLLIESNDEAKVEAAVREIKQLLLEATQAALEVSVVDIISIQYANAILQAEQRNPGGAGRYSVL